MESIDLAYIVILLGSVYAACRARSRHRAIEQSRVERQEDGDDTRRATERLLEGTGGDAGRRERERGVEEAAQAVVHDFALEEGGGQRGEHPEAATHALAQFSARAEHHARAAGQG